MEEGGEHLEESEAPGAERLFLFVPIDKLQHSSCITAMLFH